MLGRIIAIVSLGAVVALFLLLEMTTPTTIGPLGILAVFILMYMSVLGGLTFLLYEGSRVLAKVARPLATRRPLQPLVLRRAYYFSTVLALAPVMLIGMQSVGGAGLYGVSLVVIFVVIACIYISKRSQ